MDERPLAVVAEQSNMQVITSLIPAASAAGLQVGQPVRDAHAMCAGLVTRTCNAPAEAAFLTALHLFGGEEALPGVIDRMLRRHCARLADRGRGLRMGVIQSEPVHARTRVGHLQAGRAVNQLLAGNTALDDLIGRLGARVGPEVIIRRQPVSSHIPKNTAQMLATVWSAPARASGRPLRGRCSYASRADRAGMVAGRTRLVQRCARLLGRDDTIRGPAVAVPWPWRSNVLGLVLSGQFCLSRLAGTVSCPEKFFCAPQCDNNSEAILRGARRHHISARRCAGPKTDRAEWGQE
ncbi:hypothetical protein ACFMPD_10840 [Sedimentitalea sp. HM32M-2]